MNLQRFPAERGARGRGAHRRVLVAKTRARIGVELRSPSLREGLEALLAPPR